jgi:hypothetical protein
MEADRMGMSGGGIDERKRPARLPANSPATGQRPRGREAPGPLQDAGSPRMHDPRRISISLVDSITSTIQPTTWDDVGGPGSIAPLPVATTACRPCRRGIRPRAGRQLTSTPCGIASRPGRRVRIEAHWLWLTEPELAALLTGPGSREPRGRRCGRRGRLEEVAATETGRRRRCRRRRRARAFEAILKGQDGQLIGGTSGRQTRVFVTLIPVVGDPPATVAPPASAP